MMSGIHTFDFVYKKLSNRTLYNLTTLHFVHAAGQYHCLDLCITAPSLPSLIAAVGESISSLTPTENLPIAPREQWEEIWGRPMEWRRVFQQLPNKVTGHYIAAVLVNL